MSNITYVWNSTLFTFIVINESYCLSREIQRERQLSYFEKVDTHSHGILENRWYIINEIRSNDQCHSFRRHIHHDANCRWRRDFSYAYIAG